MTSLYRLSILLLVVLLVATGVSSPIKAQGVPRDSFEINAAYE